MNRTRDKWPIVAYVEVDRYCAECGYNLRQQAVTRHPDLDILICRCPECGRHHAAMDATSIGSLWLRRVGRLALIVWTLGLVAAVLGLGFGEGGLMYGTLDGLTRYQRLAVSSGETKLTIVVREMNDEDYAILTLFGIFSLASGALLGAGAATLCYHWRRRNYYVLVLVIPLLAAAVVFTLWTIEAPDLTEWGLRLIGGHAGLFIMGGVAGVLWGRPVARATIRAALPPKYWPVLCDLWLIDQKPLPQPRDSRLSALVTENHGVPDRAGESGAQDTRATE